MNATETRNVERKILWVLYSWAIYRSAISADYFAVIGFVVLAVLIGINRVLDWWKSDLEEAKNALEKNHD